MDGMCCLVMSMRLARRLKRLPMAVGRLPSCCRALAELLPGAASAVVVVAPDGEVPGGELMTVLTDTNGEFAATFRASGGTVWIVRPDGHIGWRSGSCSGEAVKSWGRVLRG
jgi:hypothetical protein